MKTLSANYSVGKIFPNPMMRIEKKETHSHAGSDTVHGHTLPVIHVDYKGRILYANKAAFPLLREWNCLANDYLPESLTGKSPALLSLDADFGLDIETATAHFHLDVIGFKEAGFIGMYGFLITDKKKEQDEMQLRVAG